MPFATQDRHKDKTLLMKQTVNSDEKTLTYKPRYHMERREDNTLGDSRHTGGKRRLHYCRACCLHFDQIPIFKCVVRVTLQGREVANTVID